MYTCNMSYPTRPAPAPDQGAGKPVIWTVSVSRLSDLFRHITPASDLVFRYGTDAPTLRVDGMTIAGR